jgi:hypothetical protein
MTSRHPLADDRLGFTTLVAGHPPAVGIGRVDRLEAGIGEAIEHGE